MKQLVTLAWIYGFTAVCLSNRAVRGQFSPDDSGRPAAQLERPVDEPAEANPPPGTIFKTLGGVQFWGDVRYFGQWRIQRNALADLYRLLDPDNGCHALGTQDHCLEKLDRLCDEHGLEPVRGPVVITMHGLGRGRSAMHPVVNYLRKHSDFTVINVSYPSTRASVADHARDLASILEHLDEATEINFVCHSLGNLVVRHYLADQTNEALGRRPDPRIRRIVMLGPPNQGAQAATTFEGNWAFRNVLGRSALEIAQWKDLPERLATPECEFGIIAGGRGNDTGWNPLLPGDDDGTVTVAEARLAGAHDFLLVNALHSFLMYDKSVLDATLRFLNQGCFAEDGVRRPIDATKPAAETE